MNKYIDANTFMLELNDAQIEFDEYYKGLGKAKVMLSLQPFADVEEVIHAKWEINSDGYYPYCSHCKTEPKNGVMSKRCPECGAKMDG